MVNSKYAIIALAVSAFLFKTGTSQSDYESGTKKFNEVLGHVERLYVDPVKKEKLVKDGIIGMHNRLTPYSSHLTNEEYSNLGFTTAEELEGIGLVFKIKRDSVMVEGYLPGSPAERVGLSEGDRIVSIDGEKVSDVRAKNYDVRKQLLGDAGSEIKLEVIRDGFSEPLMLETKREHVEGYQTVFMGDDHNGNENRIYLVSSDLKNAFKYFDYLYPDSIPAKDLAEHAIRGMLYTLDPHSIYIPGEEVAEMNSALRGNFQGIGVNFHILEDTIMITRPIPNGPSEAVGIKAGDRIVKVEEETIAGIGIQTKGVRDRLLGEKGSQVNVSIYRRGEPELLDFTITRGNIPVYSIHAAYMATPEIGYIKLNNFGAKTMSEFRAALDKLQAAGMKDLILDLQGNTGGYLNTAIELSDQFLSGNKLVVFTKGRSFSSNRELYASKRGRI